MRATTCEVAENGSRIHWRIFVLSEKAEMRITDLAHLAYSSDLNTVANKWAILNNRLEKRMRTIPLVSSSGRQYRRSGKRYQLAQSTG